MRSRRWGLRVNDLQPGQTTSAVLSLGIWSAGPITPEAALVTVEYWVVDEENGTISVPTSAHLVEAGNVGVFEPGDYVTYGVHTSTDELVPHICATSFAVDIRPLFTADDRNAMLEFLDLYSYDDVKKSADEIYSRVTSDSPFDTMPCAGSGRTWRDANAWKADLFKQWVDGGMCP